MHNRERENVTRKLHPWQSDTYPRCVSPTKTIQQCLPSSRWPRGTPSALYTRLATRRRARMVMAKCSCADQYKEARRLTKQDENHYNLNNFRSLLRLVMVKHQYRFNVLAIQSGAGSWTPTQNGGKIEKIMRKV